MLATLTQWYYIDKTEKQPKGPFSIRDLDVFIRTNTLDSNTYVWKAPMSTWKKIFQVDELKELINSTHTEVKESLIRNQIQMAYEQNLEKQQSIENYFMSSDGFWHLYNPVTKEWTKQEEKPMSKYMRKSSMEMDEILNEDESTLKKQDPVAAPNLIEITVTSPKKNEIVVEGVSTIQPPEEKLLTKKRKYQYGENIEKILTEDQIKQLERRKRKAEKQKEKKKKSGMILK